jgi:hypothetical protein
MLTPDVLVKLKRDHNFTQEYIAEKLDVHATTNKMM